MVTAVRKAGGDPVARVNPKNIQTEGERYEIGEIGSSGITLYVILGRFGL
jgi:hypothetical protein